MTVMMKNTLKTKKMYTLGEKNGMSIVAFCLPIILMQICCYQMQIWPYGDLTLFTWDLSVQYVPFLSFFREVLLGEKDALYTLMGSIGSCPAGTIAYYLGSPFNLFLIFFTKASLPFGIFTIIQVKLGCMSLFMFLLMQSKSKSNVAILFSTAYSFCAFVVAYQSNIMWLDAVVLLPLVIWGIDRLIAEKKIMLYVISLALTIWSCYYTGYMVCLFCVIYFLTSMLLMKGKIWKERIRRGFLFTVASLWSGALAAAVIIPGFSQTYGGARSGYGLGVLLNGARLYLQQSLLPMFLACSYDDSQRWEVIGYPLVYCGILSVFGVFAFFATKKIDIRKKIMTGLIGIILLLSYNHINLFIMWHAFASPHGAPWRFVFLGSFIMILTAYEGTVEVLHGDRMAGKAAFGLISLFFVWIYWRFPAYRFIVLFNALVFYGESLFILCQSINKKYIKCVLIGLSVSCLAVELCINAVYTWNQGFEFDSKSVYDNYIEQMEQIVTEDSKMNYRCETLGQAEYNLNDGFLLGINTIDVYASSEKILNKQILSRMGFGEGEVSTSKFAEGSTRLARKMLGIKYLYTEKSGFPGYKAVEESDGGLYRLEDENVLPLGYLVKEEAANWHVEDEKSSSFEYLNEYYRMLPNSGEENIYQFVENENNHIDDSSGFLPVSYIEKNLYTDGNSIYWEDVENIEKTIKNTAEITKSFQKEKDSHMVMTVENSFSEKAYVCITVPYERGWKAKVNGQSVRPVEGMGGFLLIPVNKGISTVEVNYDLLEQKLGNWLSAISLIGIFLVYMYKPLRRFL